MRGVFKLSKTLSNVVFFISQLLLLRPLFFGPYRWLH